MPNPAQRVAPFGTTVFSEINAQARAAGAINLGQGMPDFDGPEELVTAAVEALQSGLANQYPPGHGVARLRVSLAAHHAQRYGIKLDAKAGTLITPGATEAIFCALMGLVDPGDEVIVIEPYFDSYVPGILMAGAVPRFVPLRGHNWQLDLGELQAAVTPLTRAIILNTPHNPSGRVFTRTELTGIAQVCIDADLTVIADEVYEHLTYDDAVHLPIATLPGMFERTVTVGSAGKTFGMTGWKVGWITGPETLISGVRKAHQFVSFSTNHPAQLAVARGFALPDSHFTAYRQTYRAKRDLLMDGLRAAGLKAKVPQGTYFIMADFSDCFDGDDIAFAKHLIAHCGIACIPPSAFYSQPHRHLGQRWARFAFCKHDDTLHAAAEQLQKLR